MHVLIDKFSPFSYTVSLTQMGRKMNKYCTIRYLLLLASLTGFMNLVYLTFLADLRGTLELYTMQRSSSSVLRRQIASIQVDADIKAATGPSLSYLELLNLDLKDLVQRYLASSQTIAKQYELNNLQEEPQEEQVLVNHFYLPRCLPVPFLLIMVHSNPVNFMDRESIRLSWGRGDNPVNQGSWTSPERYLLYLLCFCSGSQLLRTIPLLPHVFCGHVICGHGTITGMTWVEKSYLWGREKQGFLHLWDIL